MESPQFEVNFIQVSQKSVAITGRNCGATIRVGDVFDLVYHGTFIRDAEGQCLEMLRSRERPVLLKVTGIKVYEQWSDDMSEGMTGRLYLAGTGGDDLRAFDFLTTKDLATHGHPTNTV